MLFLFSFQKLFSKKHFPYYRGTAIDVGYIFSVDRLKWKDLSEMSKTNKSKSGSRSSRSRSGSRSRSRSFSKSRSRSRSVSRSRKRRLRWVFWGWQIFANKCFPFRCSYEKNVYCITTACQKFYSIILSRWFLIIHEKKTCDFHIWGRIFWGEVVFGHWQVFAFLVLLLLL